MKGPPFIKVKHSGMSLRRVSLLCSWKGSTAKVESRWHLKILAVAAHHGPIPAFLTIKLDRASLGSIMKGP